MARTRLGIVGRGRALARRVDRASHHPAVTAVIAMFAALGVIAFYHPAQPAPVAPFAPFMRAGPSVNAFGKSREVRLRFALPSAQLEFPLQLRGDPSSLTYEWMSTRDSVSAGPPLPVSGSTFVAPSKPGFYRLVVSRPGSRQVIEQPTLAVLVPFEEKKRGVLNGYRIGNYVADKLSQHDHPDGFLEVSSQDVDLMVSTHLRLGDFLTHDRQGEVWPKYVALNPRLLDKLELVLAKIGNRARFSQADGSQEAAIPNVEVNSGFRTPDHNAQTRGAVRDSRHQYGDAADVAIDANGDGRVTLTDELIVVRAVDQVESEHPELVGGLGLYTSRRFNQPYVHIDARGTRSRWKG
ncbi:MAG TPA: D-Ala-D-Ala carboxypeptidase family metallohydrolase [Gemmatimonadaceae bacterium]